MDDTRQRPVLIPGGYGVAGLAAASTLKNSAEPLPHSLTLL